MIATSATDGEYTDAEHYATMMAEDNDHIKVNYIHGGDEDNDPFFVLAADGGGLSSDLLNWARIKGWQVDQIREQFDGRIAVRFVGQETER